LRHFINSCTQPCCTPLLHDEKITERGAMNQQRSQIRIAALTW